MMKHSLKISMAALALLFVVALAYWLGAHSNQQQVASQMASIEPQKKEPKILYYRNPMGLPDTSDVPKLDSMGMDYIPVYEGEDEGSENGTVVKISTDKVQKLGVKTSKAQLRQLSRTVRALGRVEADERRVYSIAPKFEGWVEHLQVDATGDVVKAGQVLFEVYSPELISAQREYLIALQGVKSMQEASADAKSGMQALAEASLLRLKSWDIDEEDLHRLRDTGEVKRSIAYRSPVSGIVMEKIALKGMRFMPGEMMYKIADLSTVWMIADVSEQESALLKVGQAAKAVLEAYPGREFSSRINYIYPTVNPQTRTTAVRLALDNAAGLLRPGMYAQLALAGLGSKERVVTVPDSAVIYSGRREVVLVELAEGRYEAREVRLGVQGEDYVEVMEGIGEGEKVVVSANFLIDAESNLKAVIAGFTQRVQEPLRDSQAEKTQRPEMQDPAQHKH